MDCGSGDDGDGMCVCVMYVLVCLVCVCVCYMCLCMCVLVCACVCLCVCVCVCVLWRTFGLSFVELVFFVVRVFSVVAWAERCARVTFVLCCIFRHV